MHDLGFTHIFRPGAPGARVLLLLHGTGADEHDLLGLGQAVDPAATLLSVRGKVLENGMPRFFRRLGEGVFDQSDLLARTHELADFVATARRHYGLEGRDIVALGFSNGANIATSVLLRRPEALDGAILLRAMVTFQPGALPDLAAKPVLMLNGLMDPLIPADNARTLAGFFDAAKARLTFTLKPATHSLAAGEPAEIGAWLGTL